MGSVVLSQTEDLARTEVFVQPVFACNVCRSRQSESGVDGHFWSSGMRQNNCNIEQRRGSNTPGLTLRSLRDGTFFKPDVHGLACKLSNVFCFVEV